MKFIILQLIGLIFFFVSLYCCYYAGYNSLGNKMKSYILLLCGVACQGIVFLIIYYVRVYVWIN